MVECLHGDERSTCKWVTGTVMSNKASPPDCPRGSLVVLLEDVGGESKELTFEQKRVRRRGANATTIVITHHHALRRTHINARLNWVAVAVSARAELLLLLVQAFTDLGRSTPWGTRMSGVPLSSYTSGCTRNTIIT